MMYLRGLVLFLFCLAGGARRSTRIHDSHQDAQQQSNMIANGLEVSAEAWEALIPSVLKSIFLHAGPKTGASSKESKYRAAPTHMALDDEIHNDGANVDATQIEEIASPAVAPAAVYSGSMKFVLNQTDLEFDAWNVGTLSDYPWLAEQLGIEVNPADGVLEINNEFCAANPDFCSAITASNRGGVPVMSGATDDFVPDMQRRTIMNLVLLGGAGVPVLWLAGGFVYFFVPPSGGGGGGGLTALDAQGDAVLADAWAKEHPFPTRSLVQGLKGDAHYLIVKEDGLLEDYAINAVCTHLGCVVPWNRAANKYMCPCHGSQYDPTGKVIRGPAPLSLALAHVENADGKVVLTPWTETDFRTNTAPWWKP